MLSHLLRPALAAVCVAGCGGPVAGPAPAAPVPPAAPAPAPAPTAAPQPGTDPERFPAPFRTEPAPVAVTVRFIADGDTFTLALPAAAGGGEVTVRLLGVNTPEKQSKYRDAEPWGPEVSRLVTAKLKRGQVQLIADPAKTDQYDRVLGYVLVDGADLGAWLLERGYARLFVPAPHPRRARYVALERAARAAKVGLWGGPPPAAGLIGNRRSKQLHSPDCRWLPAERNRVPFTSRAEAEHAGYTAHSCLK